MGNQMVSLNPGVRKMDLTAVVREKSKGLSDAAAGRIERVRC